MFVSRVVKIFAPADKRDFIEPQLVWATPGQRGFPSRKTGAAPVQPVPMSSQQMRRTTGAPPPIPGQTPAQRQAVLAAHIKAQKAAELAAMLNGLETVDDEGRRASLLDTLCSIDDILNLPLHLNPPGHSNGQMKVDLLRHQVR